MKGRKTRRTSSPQPHLVKTGSANFQYLYPSLEIKGEEKRLGSRSPLFTEFILSVGPLISQTVQALYGVVNLFWVSRSIGDKGIEVFGAVYAVDFITMAFADYLMTSLDIRISYLFGEKSDVRECSQIYVDFLRSSFFFGLLMPAIILPITRPLIEWFGSSKEISLQCLHYLMPTTFGSFFNFIYMVSCGLIQSEGHSIIFGITQVTSLVLNMAFFNPLFLMAFKLPIWGASLATVCSEFIVGFTLLILIFSGKFTIKPSLRMFFQPFSKQTWEALRIGVASLMENFSYSIPEILIQKYLNMAAKAIGEYDTIIEVWGIIEKLYQFVGGANDAFAIGLLPSASYAFGAKRYNRMLRLYMHANWITILFSVVYSIFMIFLPSKIASIWSKDEDVLKWCAILIPKVFYGNFCFPLEYTTPAMLQGMQKVVMATILATLTSLLPIPLFSSILYFTGKKDPERIMWTYTISDIFAALMCVCFISPYLYKLCKAPKDETLEKEETGEEMVCLKVAKSGYLMPTRNDDISRVTLLSSYNE